METKKESKQKWMMIALLLCAYFCVLIMISYLRAPEQNRREIIRQFSCSDFSQIEGMTGGYVSDGRTINLTNGSGSVSGFSTEVPLVDVEEVEIRFFLRDAEEALGKVLTVDLCAPGYDNAEQEQQVAISQSGMTVTVILTPGDNAPESAALRVFTTDELSCSISDLRVCLRGSQTDTVLYTAGGIALVLLSIVAVWMTRQGLFRQFTLHQRKKVTGKRQEAALAAAFVLVIYAPLGVSMLSKCVGHRIDAQLAGNFAVDTETPLTAQTLWNGSFQRYFETKWDAGFGLHGAVIKAYNQLRYSLFHEGTRIVGKDGSIFEPLYIYTQMGYPAEYSCNSQENRDQVEAYVERLNAVAEMLEQNGKHFMVYMTPNKADFDFPAIPDKYLAGYEEGEILTSISFFRELQSRGKFRFFYLDSAERIREQDPDWPVFYKTGIHWSRPAEQYISQLMIESMGEQLEEKTALLHLGALRESTTPYWRDADLYDLLNIWWGQRDKIYYEYEVSSVHQDTVHPDVLLIGGSFAMGLERDLAEQHISETVKYINFDYGAGYSYVRENFDNGRLTELKSMETLDFQALLDSSDIVILELNEAVLLQKSAEDVFLEHLEAFLRHYAPQIPAVDRLEQFNSETWNTAACKGFYWPEGDHVWGSQITSIQLKNEQIKDRGLEIKLNLPAELADSKKQISISVNGKRVWQSPLSEYGDRLIQIPASEIYAEDNCYLVEIETGDSFNPKQVNGDDRDLSYCLFYIGEERNAE